MSLLKFNLGKTIELVFVVLLVFVIVGVMTVVGTRISDYFNGKELKEYPYEVERYRLDNDFEILLDKNNNVICYIKENKGMIDCVKQQ